MNEVRTTLRDATRENHQRVDDAFGRFDLGSRGAYTDFLRAHARVVAVAEGRAAGLWASWSPRGPALAQDLADLGAAAPAAVNAPLPETEAGRWGLLYVLEGSRLGGRLLAGRVGEGLPRRYLTDRSAGWPAFQAALEAAPPRGDPAWLDEALAGARLTFAAFERAARDTVGSRTQVDPDVS